MTISLKIEFDDIGYFCGENVTGKVLVHSDQPTSCQGMRNELDLNSLNCPYFQKLLLLLLVIVE